MGHLKNERRGVMKTKRFWTECVSMVIISLVCAGIGHGQMSVMPEDLQEKMKEVGPELPKNLRKAYEATIEAYMPYLIAAPKAGVKVQIS
jgi:hypothetical protein